MVDLRDLRQIKRKAFEDLLRSRRIFLTLDSRVPGVKVPSEHQGKAALTLMFGKDLPVPLTDLTVDDTGIAVTLSFSRSPHHCVIPWDAVWYMIPQGDEKQGIIFDPSIPPEARQQMKEQGAELEPLDLDQYLTDKGQPKSPPRPRFDVVDGDRTLTKEESLDEVERPRPTLRIVKGEE